MTRLKASNNPAASLGHNFTLLFSPDCAWIPAMQDDAPAANAGTGNAGSGPSPDPLLPPSPVLTQLSTLNSQLPPPIPDHELIRCIGRGAYGEVWLARHARLGTLRAVKIIRRDQFDHDRPFQREFDGIRRYEPISRDHPNLVAILHVGGTDECFFYVMELADGVEDDKEKGGKGEKGNETPASVKPREAAASIPSSPFPLFSSATYSPHTLRSELKRHGALPIDRCLEIGRALAGALAHLHARGLVHRDVKPSNVIFVGGVLKLADIGLVAAVSDSRSYVGTEGYIPPEGPGAPSADCYALGKLLYELSTGHDRTAWPEPPANLPTRPDRERLLELNAILHKACAPEPRSRYADAGAMLKDLDLLRVGGSVKRKQATARRASWILRAALVALLLTVAVTSALRIKRRIDLGESASDGPPSTNEMANALCAKGLLILRADNRAAFSEAYTNFCRAIELDRNFARPYVGLLDMYTFEGGPRFPGTASNRLHAVAARLNELVPNLGATHHATSVLCWGDWDYLNALKHAQESVRRSPEYWQGHSWYGFLLTHLGLPAEGRSELRIAQRIAPSKVTIHRVFGHTYYFQRDFKNAIASYEEALRWEPNHAMAYQWIGYSRQALGDIPGAITNFAKCDILLGSDEAAINARSTNLLRAFKSDGSPGYWQEQWKLVEKDDFYRKAEIQARLGVTDAAFAWLIESCRIHQRFKGDFSSPLNYLLIDEVWDPIRNDPRFKEILEKTGFTKVMPPAK